MSAEPRPKRVAIYGPPRFWRAAFGEVRRRGDRVVRLVQPPLKPLEQGKRLSGILGDLRTGRIDEVLLDLTRQV